jgi:hypothetical protein
MTLNTCSVGLEEFIRMPLFSWQPDSPERSIFHFVTVIYNPFYEERLGCQFLLGTLVLRDSNSLPLRTVTYMTQLGLLGL